ncbi:hypothetical protein MG293_005388 [Ovis ammon polii]|uniref:Uncharacterized protein n=1 Tax=Ovis ammon polii TaxID=230172 RepID=A0AAD4UI96_OVIAM|nr:hypothetical protein MG293_005388 [Ovis ammon polii]
MYLPGSQFCDLDLLNYMCSQLCSGPDISDIGLPIAFPLLSYFLPKVAMSPAVLVCRQRKALKVDGEAEVSEEGSAKELARDFLPVHQDYSLSCKWLKCQRQQGRAVALDVAMAVDAELE